MKGTIGILCCLFVAGLLFFLDAKASTGADEVKIGASLSLSGKMTREGHCMKDGYEFWADYMNARGGIEVGDKKYQIKMVFYDDEGNAQRAAKLYEKLIAEDKVNLILGPYSSPISIATSAISGKVPLCFDCTPCQLG